jgi:hypothetical protein
MNVVLIKRQGQLMRGYDRIGDGWSPKEAEDTQERS